MNFDIPLETVHKAADWAWASLIAFGTYVYQTRQKVNKLELHVSENYAKKDDVKVLNDKMDKTHDLIVDIYRELKGADNG